MTSQIPCRICAVANDSDRTDCVACGVPLADQTRLPIGVVVCVMLVGFFVLVGIVVVWKLRAPLFGL